MGNTLPKLRGAIYWAEWSESVSKCDSGRQTGVLQERARGESEELKYLKQVSGKRGFVTLENNDSDK